MFQTYVSKPTEARAVYWDGTDDVVHALELAGCQHRWHMLQRPTRKTLQILAGVNGAQGWVDVPVGHYIIDMSANGTIDFYPCDKEVFERKYDPKSE